jgi:hypothetical protein
MSLKFLLRSVFVKSNTSFGAWRNSRIFSYVFCYRSLVLYVCLVNRSLSCCTFSVGHCVVWSSDSDYLFGNFKLFFQLENKIRNNVIKLQRFSC